MRNNLYQILKCTVRSFNADKVESTYYSVGRYEKWFFNLFGSYVWRECKEHNYINNPLGSDICQFDSFASAMKLCDHLNKPLKNKLVEKYVESDIVYDGVNIHE